MGRLHWVGLRLWVWGGGEIDEVEGASGAFERFLQPQVYAESGAVQIPKAAYAFLGGLGQKRVAMA